MVRVEKGRMDERILVCVYYGPNGERLIKRGAKLSNMLDCPLYVLTVDPLPYDEFDAEKSGYIDQWKELGEEVGVDEFFLYDNEKRPTAKVIAEVAHQYNITQIIIGQTAQNRWEEITKGSFVNCLLREMTFVDIHIVSLDRSLKGENDVSYEKGVRAFLKKEGDHFELTFTRSKHHSYEGIFYKEVGTDFNNGVFRFVSRGKTHQVTVDDDRISEKITEPPNFKRE